MTAEKFCTKCGKKFIAVGREVICPDCKAAAAEESKKAAVLKAKRASWAGESVPVRISGRASTVIRAYGAEKRLPFAAALDSLLQSTACFKGMQMAWEEVEPYKSRRRDKHATEDAQEVKAAGKPQDVQAAQEVKQDKPVKPVKQAAKKAVTVTAEPVKPATPVKASKASKASKKG